MTPLVSICLPNYNNCLYLAERFRTIFKQTYTNWELLVYDSGSTDGAWEYIVNLASDEPRMRIWQGPRDGVYPAWNECLRQAVGKYVYIATSDDTMAPNCLERLVDALEEHPECDLGHCMLRVIDGEGNEHVKDQWWREHSMFARSCGNSLNEAHLRRTPFDGFLHFFGETVYISITQLLIRRTLFDRVGVFSAKWGSIGDFNWGMRAALTSSTFHVPDTWAGWRVHSKQATSNVQIGTPEHRAEVHRMIKDALFRFEYAAGLGLQTALEKARECQKFWEAHRAVQTRYGRMCHFGRELLKGSELARVCMAWKLVAKEEEELQDKLIGWMKDTLSEAGVAGPLVSCRGDA